MVQDTQPAPLGDDAALDAWARFRVADPAELQRLLRQLCDTGEPIMLSTPQGLAVRAQLWSVDAVQRQISFSADADSVPMQRLAQSDEAVAVAYLDNVKLQFDLGGLVLVHGSHSCALRAEWPAAIYRLQRRASFRVRTVERRAPQARLRHPSMPDMLLSLRIVDIGAGGCALVLPDDVPALQPSSRLDGVRIELDSDTGFDVALRLQHVSAMHGGGQGMRLGCEFVDLDGPAQRALQRYIDQTQQRQRLLARR